MTFCPRGLCAAPGGVGPVCASPITGNRRSSLTLTLLTLLHLYSHEQPLRSKSGVNTLLLNPKSINPAKICFSLILFARLSWDAV
jgi:hypothetical protein